MSAAPPPEKVCVIAVDGTAAAGKTALTRALAYILGFNCLESGALYRAVAYLHTEVAALVSQPVEAAARYAGQHLEITTLASQGETGAETQAMDIRHKGASLSAALQSEDIAGKASQLSQSEGVRQALLPLQRACARSPGLVAEGRDMGTVVFPDAALKVFLDAPLEVRSARRGVQLVQNSGGQYNSHLNSTLTKTLKDRDTRDTQRSIAPLTASDDAHRFDTSQTSVPELCRKVLRLLGK